MCLSKIHRLRDVLAKSPCLFEIQWMIGVVIVLLEISCELLLFEIQWMTGVVIVLLETGCELVLSEIH